MPKNKRVLKFAGSVVEVGGGEVVLGCHLSCLEFGHHFFQQLEVVNVKNKRKNFRNSTKQIKREHASIEFIIKLSNGIILKIF